MHPDVTRNLMTMRTQVQASRALCLACAYALDMAEHANEDERAFWKTRGDLLTPLAKSYSTDSAVEVASIGIQIHGGMGFVEETGAAQHLRDARILPIYEGTNGIQAIDLVGRKLKIDKGENAKAFIAEMRQIADEVRASNQADFGAMGERLTSAIDDLDATTDYMLSCLANNQISDAMAGATAYQKIFALAAGAAYHAKGALASAQSSAPTSDDTLTIHSARFFAENIAPETGALRHSVLEGAGGILTATQGLLTS